MILLVQELDTTAILLAIIATVPSVLATIFAYAARRDAAHVREAVKTPSGTPIGTQVEDVQHVALANHYQLRRQNGDPMREPPLRTADVMPRVGE